MSLVSGIQTRISRTLISNYYFKNRSSFVVLTLILSLLAPIVSAPQAFAARITLTYVAGTGGTISGDAAQAMNSGGDGKPVTAVANSGYVFNQWNDGLKTESRTDLNVNNDVTYTATFTKLLTGLTPAISTPTSTSGGFTASITNYSANSSNYSFAVTTSAGSVTNTNGSLVVSGLTPGQPATITVTTTRSGYTNGTATVTGSALLQTGLTPTLATATITADGFTSSITNWSNSYGYTAVTTAGVVALSGSGAITVTGLTPGTSATVTVTATRSGYTTTTATVSGSVPLLTGLTPTLSAATSASGGFTASITNFASNSSTYSFSATTTAGSVALSGSTITVTGLTPGASATVTITTTRSGYTNGTGTVTGSALLLTGLTPTLATATITADGFTTSITNFDSAYTYTQTTSAGSISRTNGAITVTGLSPGQSATVTVTATRSGYTTTEATVSGSVPLQTGLTPTVSEPTSTADGFTFEVSSIDSNYTYTPSTSAGSVASASIAGGNRLRITVTTLSPGASATVTITTTRSGYTNGTATVTGSALLQTGLTPTLATATITADGFTSSITNWSNSYGYTAVTTAGVVALSGSGAITVTGLTPGTSATVTVTATRSGYTTTTATVSGSVPLLTGLTPTLSAATSASGGFTASITNFASNSSTYSFSATTTAGSVALSGSTITVTGLTPGASATVTITTTRSGYTNGTGTVTGSALLLTGLTPTLATATITADGFTTSITNFDSAYTYTQTTSAGSISRTNGAITVTGLSPGQSATVTVTATRSGYTTTEATVSGSVPLQTGLTPTVSEPTSTADGFTFEVSSIDSNYTYTPSTSAGSVASASIAGGNRLRITVTTLSPGASATVTITTTRSGYTNGTATVTGSALLQTGLTPTLATATITADGFTSSITNWSNSYGYTAVTTAGVVALSGSGAITVTGLTPGTSATVTVTATRSGYTTTTATVSGSVPLLTGLTPTLSAATSASGGFTASITNFASNSSTYSFSATTTAGSVALSGSTITVTGLTPGASATVTITTTRSGYTNGTGTVTGSALLLTGLTPTLATATITADGFTTSITNFDSAYTYTQTTSAGSISRTNGAITVTGLSPGQSATVTVTATRSGYTTTEATVSGSVPLQTGLTPTVSEPTSTADGFTFEVSSIDSNYTYTPSTSAGSVASASIAGGNRLRITVTTLSPGASATVTITTTRSGYTNGTATVTGSALLQTGLTPTLATATITADGFTSSITNWSNSYGYTAVTTAGVVALSGSGAITVTGLTPGTSATVTVTATRSGYTTTTATVSGSVPLLTGLTPTLSAATSASGGFTASITNFASNSSTYSFSATTTAGSVALSGSTITVTGLTPGASATVTITTTRSGYTNGTGTVTGSALLLTGLTPTLATATITADGFTTSITNFDSAYTYTQTTSAGSISRTNGAITVTGLSPGQSATVTVTATRSGYTTTEATVSGSVPLQTGLTPTVSEPTSTADGFTFEVSSIDSNYTYTPSTSAGSVASASIAGGNRLRITVTTLSPGASATVTITTTRSGYTNGTATVTGSAEPLVVLFSLNYTGTTGGSILGSTSQTVKDGQDGNTVTATPEEGYEFIGWSDNSSTNPVRKDVNVRSNKSVAANFARKSYTLSYDSSDAQGGSVSGSKSQSISHGNDATEVVATALDGYTFTGWSDGVTTPARTDRSVTAGKSVTANFAKKSYTLSYDSSDAQGGSVSGSKSQSISHGNDATEVTATALDGYTFTGWSDGVTTPARTDRSITAAKSVTANFVKKNYTLTYESLDPSSGSINGSKSQNIDHGNDATEVTAIAAEGYIFIEWSDGVATASRIDRAVTSSKSPKAKFEKIKYTIRFEPDTGANVDRTTADVDYGSNSPEVTAVLKSEDVEFAGWYDASNNLITSSTKLSLTSVKSSQTYSAKTVAKTAVDKTVELQSSHVGSTINTFGSTGECPLIVNYSGMDCWHFVLPSSVNQFTNVDFKFTVGGNPYTGSVSSVIDANKMHAWAFTPVGANVVLLGGTQSINGTASRYVLSHVMKGVALPECSIKTTESAFTYTVSGKTITVRITNFDSSKFNYVVSATGLTFTAGETAGTYLATGNFDSTYSVRVLASEKSDITCSTSSTQNVITAKEILLICPIDIPNFTVTKDGAEITVTINNLKTGAGYTYEVTANSGAITFTKKSDGVYQYIGDAGRTYSITVKVTYKDDVKSEDCTQSDTKSISINSSSSGQASVKTDHLNKPISNFVGEQCEYKSPFSSSNSDAWHFVIPNFGNGSDKPVFDLSKAFSFTFNINGSTYTVSSSENSDRIMYVQSSRGLYVFTPIGGSPASVLSSASAFIESIDGAVTEFNLSHACAGTPKKSSTTVTQISKSSITITAGTSNTEAITDQVTVTGSFGTPTGSVTFYYCYSPSATPATCSAATGTSFSTKSLSGGVATSDAFTPTNVGYYLFHAVYGGNTTYNSSFDDGTNEAFELKTEKKSSTTVTQISKSSITITAGTSNTEAITDQVTVTGSFGTPTGSVTFYYCYSPSATPATCSAATGTSFSTKSLSGGVATSDAFTPTNVGYYLFHAVYGGNTTYNSSFDDGTNEAFELKTEIITPPNPPGGGGGGGGTPPPVTPPVTPPGGGGGGGGTPPPSTPPTAPPVVNEIKKLEGKSVITNPTTPTTPSTTTPTTPSTTTPTTPTTTPTPATPAPAPLALPTKAVTMTKEFVSNTVLTNCGAPTTIDLTSVLSQMPNAKVTIMNIPANGVMSQPKEYVWVFTPNANFCALGGNDQLMMQVVDEKGNIKVVQRNLSAVQQGNIPSVIRTGLDDSSAGTKSPLSSHTYPILLLLLTMTLITTIRKQIDMKVSR